MSIAQSILANPSKYSLAQLTQGVQNGVIPAYIGVPIIQEKMQEQARMQAMGQGQDQGQGQQPPIAEQVLQQADAQTSQESGVNQLPSNLPESYAGGGIIAFNGTGTSFVPSPEFGGYTPEALQPPTRTGRSQEEVEAIVQALRAQGKTIGLPQIMDIQEGRLSAPTAPAVVPTPTPAATPVVTAPGINTLIPPRLTPAAGAPTALGQGPLAMPKPPKPAQSMEDLTRTEFERLGQRSDRRTSDLLEAQAKNKMEGKPFDSLKKTLEDEAKQAGVEKSDAKAMAIFKAGLAMMSGTSRHALENIGKGAMTGAEDYQKAAADLKKADKERQKQLAAIDEARRAEDRDDMKTRNAQLDKASTAAQRMDELGINAIVNATGKDRDSATEIWKTEYGGAKAIEAAKISAGATMGAAQVGAASRMQAALLAGGAPKGALTQDQLIKNRQTIAESPQIAAFKKQLIDQYGKNVVNQPRFQEDVNKRIDQILMQMAAQPGAATAGPKLTPEQQSLLNKYLSPQ